MSDSHLPIAPLSSGLPLRLLIVEDSALDAELLLLSLEQANVQFTYEIADQLATCQQLLQTHHYAAVITDFRLAGFTAYQVLDLLQQCGQEIPLILTTGMLGEEAAVDCIKAGMTDYVLKDRLFRLPMVLSRSLAEFELRRQQQEAVAQIQRQALGEAIINRIVQAMRGTLVLSSVLQTTVNLLQDALQVSHCLVLQAMPDQQIQRSFISQAAIDCDNWIGLPSDFYQHYLAKLNRGEALIFHQTDASLPAQYQASFQDCQVQSLLSLPLVYQTTFQGAISLHQCDRRRDWTPDEIHLVRTIADQCAIAIHQAQLFEQIQQQAQQERLLNQISQTLNSSLDPDYILQEIVRLTGQCFQAEHVLIYSITAESAHILNEWRSHAQVPVLVGLKFPRSDWLDLQDPNADFNGRRCFHAPDYAALSLSPTRRMFVEQFQVRSMLSVPVFIRDRLFGGLTLQTLQTQRTFSEAEIHLLQRIADQTAIALYNAQSYETLEQVVQERTSELEQAKHRAESANETKTDFLANMSHELRTPLTSILGFSSVLLKQVFGGLNERQVQYLERLHASAEHLLALINDLLDLSKVEAGQELLQFESLEVRELCELCIDLIQERATQQGLELALTIAPEVETCIADRRRLRQILDNLLSNAIKFTESGSVSLSVTKAGSDLRFAIKDTGIGIAAADLGKLFQPFQQLESGLDRKYQGTGLGLALVRRLVLLHGGAVTVTSEVGYGSCFTVHLPISQPQVLMAERSRDPAVSNPDRH